MKRLAMFAAVVIAAVFAAGSVMAADGATVYSSKCAMCHGKAAEGSAMAPALKGNEFIVKGKDEDIKKTIVEGRSAKAGNKKYPDIKIDMPKWDKLTAEEVDGVIAYVKGLK